MAGFAKSNGQLTVLCVNDKREFIKHFNETVPSRDFIESCNRARSLFEDGGKKTSEKLPS